jgi:hypothetical protein
MIRIAIRKAEDALEEHLHLLVKIPENILVEKRLFLRPMMETLIGFQERDHLPASSILFILSEYIKKLENPE